MPHATLSKLQLSQNMINNIRNASIEDNICDESVLAMLKTPPKEQISLDSITEVSIIIFIALGDSSEQSYADIKQALQNFFHIEIDSYFVVKRKIERTTGVIPVETDMCPNGCVAFTGLFATDVLCPKCETPRYQEKTVARKKNSTIQVPHKRFYTLPLGPQLQALWRTAMGAEKMEYRHRKTVEISNQLIETNGVVPVFGDVFHGSEYLEVVRAGNINEHDTAILFSLDGAQLYRSKESDCWFFVWIVLNLAPELQYKKKHILPAGIVPGPNKPDNIESFILPSFRHLSELQKDGLMIWHGGLQKTIKTHPFFMYATADTLALPIISGLVGHSGSHGCRLYCGFRSRNKPRHPTYYPAALKPVNPQYKCGFPDFDMRLLGSPDPNMYYGNLCRILESPSQAAYTRLRLATGIVRPSLCLGLAQS
ncbi:hypothetical protein M378DRAFT_91369 [Amanita muscaria Koide BX008]|uniref:Uncharacterized protein n=1 Tax=Amanita muscaria (strain Koide BX008) TaxID=946122 RepID=A0A0C2RXU3_AMAMK|nr:hypothetical protein M378DRAFT_91369 [Amanita muscaria Koide BX008]